MLCADCLGVQYSVVTLIKVYIHNICVCRHGSSDASVENSLGGLFVRFLFK